MMKISKLGMQVDWRNLNDAEVRQRCDLIKLFELYIL